ncbi:MAG: hypothetical protein PUK40_03065 [Actinomycetaceae bacterium]|nr:FeoC-like transcriptional regulator [Arcanobacterium sp.]MDD7504922.1 hypothetical protein [Actinomycetaceae bacterium]MDY6143268.1 hypothetical protein [Arcanobacterium sp.]
MGAIARNEATREPNMSDRVLKALRQGYSAPEIARKFNTSQVFVEVMLDHFGRLGMADSAQTLCSSGLGACGPAGATTVEAEIACAGCPLVVKRK